MVLSLAIISLSGESWGMLICEDVDSEKAWALKAECWII